MMVVHGILRGMMHLIELIRLSCCECDHIVGVLPVDSIRTSSFHEIVWFAGLGGPPAKTDLIIVGNQI